MNARRSSHALLASRIDAYLRATHDSTEPLDDLLAAAAEPDARIELAALVDRVIAACGEAGRIVHVPAEQTVVLAPATPLALAIASLLYVATAGPPIAGAVDVRTTRNADRAQVIVTARVATPERARALTAVRKLARLHGGDLIVDAAARFTRYCLDLPAAALTPESVVSVLLVDDSVEQVAALAELLECDGVAIDIATTGADALARLGRTALDVLVSDVELPDMSGIDVIRRARTERPQLRTVLVSGYPSNHPRIAGVLPEISAYFSKPVDIDELFEVVTARALEHR